MNRITVQRQYCRSAHRNRNKQVTIEIKERKSFKKVAMKMMRIVIIKAGMILAKIQMMKRD
jgi:hypothetical protein